MKAAHGKTACSAEKRHRTLDLTQFCGQIARVCGVRDAAKDRKRGMIADRRPQGMRHAVHLLPVLRQARGTNACQPGTMGHHRSPRRQPAVVRSSRSRQRRQRTGSAPQRTLHDPARRSTRESQRLLLSGPLASPASSAKGLIRRSSPTIAALRGPLRRTQTLDQ